MQVCSICSIEKPFDDFHTSAMNHTKRDHRCKSCKSRLAREKRAADYFNYYCRGKKSECKKKGFEFNLTKEHLEEIWTGFCPIFGTELFRAVEGMGSHKSAHLDRIDPKKGYVIGNVAWISGRANRIKYDATAEELHRIADWMESATTIETVNVTSQEE